MLKCKPSTQMKCNGGGCRRQPSSPFCLRRFWGDRDASLSGDGHRRSVPRLHTSAYTTCFISGLDMELSGSVMQTLVPWRVVRGGHGSGGLGCCVCARCVCAVPCMHVRGHIACAVCMQTWYQGMSTLHAHVDIYMDTVCKYHRWILQVDIVYRHCM